MEFATNVFLLNPPVVAISPHSESFGLKEGSVTFDENIADTAPGIGGRILQESQAIGATRAVPRANFTRIREKPAAIPVDFGTRVVVL